MDYVNQILVFTVVVLFDCPSYFFDIVIEQGAFSCDFCKLVACSVTDLDVYEDRPVVIKSSNFIKRQCDLFQLYEAPEDLMNGKTSLLIRLYINLISEDIAKLNITISEESKIICAIFNYAADLMYKFWDQNLIFCFEMFDIILPKDYGAECFVVRNNFFSEEQSNEKNGTCNG